MANSLTTKKKGTVSTNGLTAEHIMVGGNQVSNMATASIKAAKMKNQDSGSKADVSPILKTTKFKR